MLLFFTILKREHLLSCVKLRIRVSIISWQLGPTATLSTQYYCSSTARLPRVVQSDLPIKKHARGFGSSLLHPAEAFNRAVMIQTRMLTAAAWKRMAYLDVLLMMSCMVLDNILTERSMLQ
jgi:hypothetical protein